MTRERELERAALFRARAAELREIAPTMGDMAAASQLLRMALTYDTLAIKLEGPSNKSFASEGLVEPTTSAE
jgi:hypothetical protein